jgi:hypothetical protein
MPSKEGGLDGLVFEVAIEEIGGARSEELEQ